MKTRDDILQRMKTLEEYFQHHSYTNELFYPEFLCAKKVREELEHRGYLNVDDANKIIRLHNETNLEKHFNGTGWHDYQLRLIHLLKEDNFNVEVDNINGMIKLNRNSKPASREQE